jgi:hypothetical protein
MELDADDMKRELLRKSAKHRQEIEGEFKLITANTEKIITNALIIGGSLALTYFLVRQLSGSRKKSKGKHRRIKVVQAEAPEVVEVAQETHAAASPGVIGQVGAALASQASLFLLNLAKEKLMEYLQTVGEKKTEG